MRLRSFAYLSQILLVLVFVSSSLASPTPQSKTNEILGKFRNTNYYVVDEAEYSKFPLDDEILDLKGRVLAKVSTRFHKDVDIEGTGKLTDGRVINYAGIINKEIRYKISQFEYGLGVGNCPLIPFHTIAVDPQTIPLGAVVKIRETVGMLLPDGTKHNGLWRAEDVGGAIKKDRIDLFVGLGEKNGSVLVRSGIKNLMPLTVELIEPPSSDSCVHHLQDLFE